MHCCRRATAQQPGCPVSQRWSKAATGRSTDSATARKGACSLASITWLTIGSDAPFDATGGRSSIRESIASVRESTCTEEEKRNIFTTNVERFFNLTNRGA